MYQRLCSSANRTPLLHELPKVHRPRIPLRPFVSFIQSPTYQLSQHLSHLLSPLVGTSASVVCNSKDSAVFSATEKLEEGESFVSFHVISLYTNIPQTWQLMLPSATCPWMTPSVRRLSSVCRALPLFCASTWMVPSIPQWTALQQTFGTAMGSPVSVTVANLVMEEIEQQLSPLSIHILLLPIH